MSLAAKVSDEQIVVLDELAMDQPKTAELAGILKAMGQAEKTVLLVIDQHSPNINLSGRNIAGLKVLPLADVNAYEVLRPDVVVATRAAMDQLKERCSQKPYAGIVGTEQEVG